MDLHGCLWKSKLLYIIFFVTNPKLLAPAEVAIAFCSLHIFYSVILKHQNTTTHDA